MCAALIRCVCLSRSLSAKKQVSHRYSVAQQYKYKTLTGKINSMHVWPKIAWNIKLIKKSEASKQLNPCLAFRTNSLCWHVVNQKNPWLLAAFLQIHACISVRFPFREFLVFYRSIYCTSVYLGNAFCFMHLWFRSLCSPLLSSHHKF